MRAGTSSKMEEVWCYLEHRTKYMLWTELHEVVTPGTYECDFIANSFGRRNKVEVILN